MERKEYYNNDALESLSTRPKKKAGEYKSKSIPSVPVQSQKSYNTAYVETLSNYEEQVPQSYAVPDPQPTSSGSFPFNFLNRFFGKNQSQEKISNSNYKSELFNFHSGEKLPAKVPQFTDQPDSFPILGGYSKDDITSSDNLVGTNYDLGKDGAFSDYSVLVIMFINFLDPDWPNCAGAALKQKGFNVTYCTCNEVDKFVTEIKSGKYRVVWILSSGGGYVDGWVVDPASTYLKDDKKELFISAVVDYHKNGGGLFLWGDNEPYYYEMNLILQQIAKINNDEKKPSYIQLSGNTNANRVLSYGDPTKPGKFDKNHIIFSGISYLYEGVTICYPVIQSSNDDSPTGDSSTYPSAEVSFAKTVGEYDVMATSSNGKPVILKIEKKNGCGRVIIDSGWTKLYQNNWTTVGQSRYVVNACVWLLD